MAEIKLTDEQQAVVDDRGGTLLVSAAAGSGKTRVLIDRVLKRVMQENCNVDEFLMITFTKAAASELRGKLISGLSEQLALRPNDRHLQEQMSRVYLAQISTVHSFCQTLLREYAHELDLPADFRVMEDEASELKVRVMRDLLEEIYHEKTTEFAAAIDMLGAGRDDEMLAEQIFDCVKTVCCRRDPRQALQQMRERLEFEACTDASETVWGAYLLSELRITLEGYLRRLGEGQRVIDETDWLAPYTPAFAEMKQIVSAMIAAQTWDELLAVPLRWSKLNQVRNKPDPALKDYVKGILDSVKAGLEKSMKRLQMSSKEALSDLEQSAPALRGLLTLTQCFLDKYSYEKKRRHLLDYNDLEQETLRLLYGRSNSPTAAAREIGKRFRELMIDEYQDTNAVQDAIFSAISEQGKNLFFVGDVKQSIYGFRMAEPEIFLEKYKAFDSYKNAKDGEPRKVLLSDNFRSIAPVLEAANDVFRLNMKQRTGGLDYGDDEALRPKSKEFLLSPAVELHCIDPQVDADLDESNIEIEAEFVARRIVQLMHEETLPNADGTQRPIVAEDIVILLRSVAEKAVIFQQALQRHGIDCVCGSENLFETEEIGFLYAFLQVLDNPHQDIPLLTVLFSSVMRFPADELARLRGKNRQDDLFDLLQESDAAQPFLQTLQTLRDTARQGSMHELLDVIDEALQLREIFPNGRQNLDRFLTLADRFEGTDRFGLSAFVQYLTTLRGEDMTTDESALRGAVRVMTIHKSKGLEFPVVILADLCKTFNNRDAMGTVLTDPELGIAAKVYEPEQSISYPTIAHTAISTRITRENRSEEMRVLYVAMTRAKYRLLMTCCKKGLRKQIASMAVELRDPIDPMQIESADSFAKWIILTALTHTESGALYADSVEGRHVVEHPWYITMSDGTEIFSEDEAEEVETEQAMDIPEPQAWHYSHEAAAHTPSKLTATQLKGRVLDAELSEQNLAPSLRFSKPRFDRHGLSATQRGTAIHLAMQYLDYHACSSEAAVKQEIARLVQERFLTPEQAQAVPPRTLLHFFRSELGQRVLRAERLVREFKFSILEDAEGYDNKLVGEKLLLQGVTDCCIIENGTLNILDFKSDRIAHGEEAVRAEHYRGQLDAYSRALSRIFGLPVKDRILYFFATDTAFYI